jgi:hypothetical protein
MGMSPPINMNNMLPLQYDSAANATAQPEHGSTAQELSAFYMTILGPVHASKSCHTIHHEAKDMPKVNRES